MKLLPNENILIVSNNDTVVLTDQRIRMTDQILWRQYSTSIFLEDISAIEVKFTGSLFSLIFAGTIFLVSLAQTLRTGNDDSLSGGFILSAIICLSWFFFKTQVFEISSKGGGKLRFIADGMSKDTIEEFIYQVSLAKQMKEKPTNE